MSGSGSVTSEESLIEHLLHNRGSFQILRLQWEMENISELTQAIRSNQTVRNVFLYDHFLSSMSMNERKEILKAIGSLHKLESLVYISNSTRVKFPMEALGEVVRTSKNLTTFELHGPNLVGNRSDFYEFNHFLGRLSKLKTFKLLPAFYGHGSVDIDHMMNALTKIDTLEEIRICLYCDRTSLLTTSELKKLCRSEVLQILDLRWPHMGDEHLTAIASELKDNRSIRELRIGGDELVNSCFAVAEMLVVNEGIECLSLACKGLSNDDCCRALWSAFDNNSILREITLENTDYTHKRDTENAALMGRVLANNTSIKMLRLYNMGVDDDACSCISRGLQVNTTLRVLDLRKGNRNITNTGFEALAHMLERNYSLQSLQTNATGPIKRQIDVCLSLNKSAKKLEVDLGADKITADFRGAARLFLCGSCR